jgi:hypothetical protein
MKPLLTWVALVIALVAPTSVGATETISGPARLVDADTVDIGSRRVRLKGVDAAERFTPLANGLKTDDETELAKLKPVLKIFLPHIRWYLVSLKADLDTAFAVVQLGAERPEAGLVSLSDIVNSRLGAYVRPERDLYCDLDQPWTWYLNEEDAA